MKPEVRVISYVRGTTEDERRGLLGFLRVAYGELILDSVVLRRTSEGRYALAFPSRDDRAGRRHAIVRPAHDDARREIERQVLADLANRSDFSGSEEGGR